MKNVTKFVHLLISNIVSKDDICIDMTIGNGNDSLFLASSCAYLYGFDIQQLAITNTTELLKSNNISNYQLFLANHELIDTYIDINTLKKVKCFVYNLGYLPKANKNITTNLDSTLNSLKKILTYLNNKSYIFITCYVGHEQGKIEADGLLEYVKKLDSSIYEVSRFDILNQDNNPPFVLIIERR